MDGGRRPQAELRVDRADFLTPSRFTSISAIIPAKRFRIECAGVLRGKINTFNPRSSNGQPWNCFQIPHDTLGSTKARSDWKLGPSAQQSLGAWGAIDFFSLGISPVRKQRVEKKALKFLQLFADKAGWREIYPSAKGSVLLGFWSDRCREPVRVGSSLRLVPDSMLKYGAISERSLVRKTPGLRTAFALCFRKCGSAPINILAKTGKVAEGCRHGCHEIRPGNRGGLTVGKTV